MYVLRWIKSLKMTQFCNVFAGCYETSRTLKIKCFMHEIPKPLQVFESKFLVCASSWCVVNCSLHTKHSLSDTWTGVSALAAFNAVLVLMLLPFFSDVTFDLESFSHLL